VKDCACQQIIHSVDIYLSISLSIYLSIYLDLRILITCVLVCTLGVDTQQAQLMKDLEKEKEICRTVRSELEQSLQTSTTQHASLQTQYASLQDAHTKVQEELVHVIDKYKTSMQNNLELQEKLHKAQVHQSDCVSQRCSWCVTTTRV
jgi:septal ring factor EnvC (AmiA/AmiB activator)